MLDLVFKPVHLVADPKFCVLLCFSPFSPLNQYLSKSVIFLFSFARLSLFCYNISIIISVLHIRLNVMYQNLVDLLSHKKFLFKSTNNRKFVK